MAVPCPPRTALLTRQSAANHVLKRAANHVLKRAANHVLKRAASENMFVDICDTGLLTAVISFLRQAHVVKLACTSRTARRCVMDITGARGFRWRVHDDIEEVLARVRQQFDFGPEYFPWSKGVGWRQCIELFTRAMEQARSDNLVVVIGPANPQPLGILGWAGFKVAKGREHEWRQRMLTMATGDAFQRSVLERYRFLQENPTWCVYEMLVDLGFRQALPRAMPRANLPQRLKQPDQLWYREWLYCEDKRLQNFRQEIDDLKAEVRRGKRFADALAAAGAATKRRKAKEAAEAAEAAQAAQAAQAAEKPAP
jgi:hypothetical protein